MERAPSARQVRSWFVAASAALLNLLNLLHLLLGPWARQRPSPKHGGLRTPRFGKLGNLAAQPPSYMSYTSYASYRVVL